LARYIHSTGSRAGQPFVRVNCEELAAARDGAALCGTLAQELNGGSMAYALCERARGGTLFLDRIGTLDHELQTRLLSWLLQNASAADVRLLATRDPAEALASCLAAAGLPVVEIVVPPLRQRRSDIPVLVEHFLQLYIERHGVSPRPSTPGDGAALAVRLAGERARARRRRACRVLSRTGVIRTADLPSHICTVPRVAVVATASAAGTDVAAFQWRRRLARLHWV
jgi:DNA-binding NtrC family response regulator